MVERPQSTIHKERNKQLEQLNKQDVEMLQLARQANILLPELLNQKDIDSPLYSEQITNLRRIIRKIPDLEVDLIKRNNGIIKKIALRYIPVLENQSTLDLDDLLQTCRIAVLDAAYYYSEGLKIKFSSYAANRMIWSINKLFDNQAQTVRYPVNINQKIREVRRTILFLQDEGQLYDNESVAEKLDITPEIVRQMKELYLKNRLQVGLNDRDRHDPKRKEWLDIELLPRRMREPEDSIVNVHEEDDIDFVVEEFFRENLINNAVSTAPLSDREREVLNLHYPIGEPYAKILTLEEIGEALGLTRERIRQIETAALKKIRRKIPPQEQYEYLITTGSSKRIFGSEDL